MGILSQSTLGWCREDGGRRRCRCARTLAPARLSRPPCLHRATRAKTRAVGARPPVVQTALAAPTAPAEMASRLAASHAARVAIKNKSS
ncbi:hypothetical protein O3G_MSEX011564 [Manduca sexta]|uniref:Uncharacterized protein n=1 Tax=Manduca sexta TaxID=7130 RepID=A0A922CUB8_MANSE|nr:hypothetical protein O3G_MSEX011564 [Manduca sexta]